MAYKGETREKVKRKGVSVVVVTRGYTWWWTLVVVQAAAVAGGCKRNYYYCLGRVLGGGEWLPLLVE